MAEIKKITYTDSLRQGTDKINSNFDTVVDEIKTVDDRVDTIIVGGGPDKDPELVDIRNLDPSYTPQREINVAGDVTRDMQAQFAAHKADIAQREINIMYPPPPLVGAKDDGTDQSTVIQAIIDSLPNVGVIFVPEGTFIAAIKLKSGIKVKGAGIGKSVLKLPDGANKPVIDNQNHTPHGTDKGLHLEGLTIDGNGSMQTVDSEETSTVRWRGVDGFSIIDCEIMNGRYRNIFLGYCINGTVARNLIHDNLLTANVVVSGNGVDFTGPVTFEDNTIYNSAMDGIIVNVPYTNLINNRIIDSGMVNPAAGIFMIATSKDCKIIGNTVLRGSIGIDINGASDIEVIGNTSKFNGKGGIWAYNGAKRIKIIGNTCANNNQSNTDVYGGIGIVQAGTERCVVEGNICYDDQETPTQDYGLYLVGSEYNIVRGNITFGNKINHFYVTANNNSELHFLTPARSEIRNNLTISGESYTGVKGRNILSLNGSADNNHIQVTTNKARVRITNSAGVPIAWQHAWYGGSTSNRPTNPGLHEPYFDTTLGKPIWCKSVDPIVWVDATGAIV